jgi:hypothetical protein
MSGRMVTPGLGERVHGAVRGLTPGYFALVMASGIISVGMLLNGFVRLSLLALGVCAVSYVVLILLTGWRLLAYRSQKLRHSLDGRPQQQRSSGRRPCQRHLVHLGRGEPVRRHLGRLSRAGLHLAAGRARSGGSVLLVGRGSSSMLPQASSSPPGSCCTNSAPPISTRRTGWPWVPAPSPSSPPRGSSRWPTRPWSPRPGA